MKKQVIPISLVLILLAGLNQAQAQEKNPKFDPKLAKELGADDYGMKLFSFVMLTNGTNTSTDKALIDSCFRGHMKNINRLVEEGLLLVAGPMGKNTKGYRGIFIFDVADTTELRMILDTDPAINNDLLGVDIYQWYGSAALETYLEASDKIWRINP